MINLLIKTQKLAAPLIALFFVLSFTVKGIHAQEALSTNGCGPKGFWSIVPDSTLLSGCDFSSACNKHDICYGKCLEGGTLYGQAGCEDKTKRLQRKKICDVSLRDDIRKDNPTTNMCWFYSSIYHLAVSKLGIEHFYGIDDSKIIDENIKEFRRFLKYVNKYPSSFSPSDVKKSLEQFSSIENLPENSNVIFEAFTPALVVIIPNENNGKKPKIIEIKGELPKKKK